MAVTDHGIKVYEFNGSRFHKNCPKCGSEPDPKWDQKVADIKLAGYYLEIIWECQYDRNFHRLEYKETPHFPQILKMKTTEAELLNSIKSGELFGFILADVRSPPDVIKNMKEFPPIIKKLKITDDHLTHYTKERLKLEKPNLKKFERETLVQCFHGEQLLIMTPLAQFYMDKGIEITNVTKFIQYIPSTALNPFATHVTRMRIDAEKNSLPTKGSTAKVFGNSSYGKVICYILFLTEYECVVKIK